MTDKELERAQVRELRRSCIVVLTTGTREGVVHLRIIMKRHQRIRTERRVNLRLRFRRAKLVESRDVQHQWAGEVLRLVEIFLDADAVITNRTIRLEAR